MNDGEPWAEDIIHFTSSPYLPDQTMLEHKVYSRQNPIPAREPERAYSLPIVRASRIKRTYLHTFFFRALYNAAVWHALFPRRDAKLFKRRVYVVRLVELIVQERVGASLCASENSRAVS